MSLTNAIAIIRRQDAKVKVEVPAAQGRKAYSYMREGSDNPSTPKSGVSKKMIGGAIAGVVGVGALTAGVLALNASKSSSDKRPLIGGAIGAGALTAGVLAMRRTKKTSESQNIGLRTTEIDDDEQTNKTKALQSQQTKGAIGNSPVNKSISGGKTSDLIDGKERRSISASNEIDVESREVSNGITGASPKLLKGSDVIDVESREVSNAIAGTNIRGALKPEKGLLDRGVAVLRKMTEKGIERDRKAGGAFANREIDLNKAAYSAGEKSRMAAQNLATFAKASVEVFGRKQPKAVDVNATEVNEVLPEGKPMQKEPKPKKAKTPKVPKQKSPTAAERRAIQKQLNDLNK